MICEYTGVAETEAYAHQVLAGKEASITRDVANGLTPKLPFVLYTAGGAYADSATQDYYNYAPATILWVKLISIFQSISYTVLHTSVFN